MVCSGRSLQRPTRTNRRRRTDEKRRPEGLKARIAKRRPTQPLRLWQVLLAEEPSRAAAPTKLPLSTTFEKTRMLSKQSMELSDHCVTSKSLFDPDDINKDSCRVHSIKRR